MPLTGGTFALQNGTSAYLGLFNVSTGAYQGSLVAVSGASGSLPSFTPSAQDTFAYKLTSDSAGANVLFTSPNIAVEAAFSIASTVTPDSTLDFLVPQIAGHTYSVRLVTTDGNETLIWDSATFAVTAAPGALPAQISSFTTSSVTTTGLT